jgi:hypothetical protein
VLGAGTRIMNDVASLDLGVVGNCVFSALVDRDARVVWACLPRPDGDPVFHSLVHDVGGDEARGFWSVELVGRNRSEQDYVGNTAILSTRLYSENGSAIEVIDFCPRFERRGRMFRPQTLVRRVRTLAGTPRIRVRLRPGFGYGTQMPTITHGSNHIRYVSADRVLRLTTDAPVSYLLSETPFLLETAANFVLGADETLTDGVRARTAGGRGGGRECGPQPRTRAACCGSRARSPRRGRARRAASRALFGSR